MTAFLYIPQELLINKETIKLRSPEIDRIFAKHPELFKYHNNAEHLQLILYVMHEQLKGKESFFYPYFQIVNRSDLPFLWESGQVKEFQDAVLQNNIEIYRAEFELEWELFYKTFKDWKHDYIIPGISDPANKDTLK